MAKPNKIISDLEDLLDGMNSKYSKNLSKELEGAYDIILEFMASLKKNPNGSLKMSVENLRAINKFMPQLKKELAEGGYGKQVGGFVKDFQKVQVVSDSYFTALVGSKFANNSALYNEILKQNIDTTIETLTGSGLDANVLKPIRQIMTEQISGGATLKEFRGALKEQLIESGQPTRWVTQQSKDSLSQFTSNYIQTISADLGMEYFLYQGTKMKTSRDFCAKRHGRYFTKKEVQSWANLEWQGKMAGTNEVSIFSNKGGYNCNHQIIPVTKEIYENGTKGFR
jgi:hypothetical protein